jgi:hypothetical protein
MGKKVGSMDLVRLSVGLLVKKEQTISGMPIGFTRDLSETTSRQSVFASFSFSFFVVIYLFVSAMHPENAAKSTL